MLSHTLCCLVCLMLELTPRESQLGRDEADQDAGVGSWNWLRDARDCKPLRDMMRRCTVLRLRIKRAFELSKRTEIW